MADRFGTEQNLKNHPRLTRYPVHSVFSGWSRRAGMADCRSRSAIIGWREVFFRTGRLWED
jgi:hypothetical protein